MEDPENDQRRPLLVRESNPIVADPEAVLVSTAGELSDVALAGGRETVECLTHPVR
jgi:hypothetical protein